MKQQSGAARRYAQALFEIALEREAVDQWARELGRVADVMADPTAARLLSSPARGVHTKRRAIDVAAGPLSREVGRLIDLLLERKRANLFPALAESFADRVREHRGILRAEVTSAVPLSEAERELLAARLGKHFGQAVELHARVDPGILGGVIARVGDRLLEGSIRGRLERLREQLVQGGAY